jgi:hypothetical protein
MDPAQPPNFHPKQHLGLAQMRHVIENLHESVIYRGRLISRAEHLPTEAQIAAADDYYKVQAEGNLEAQIRKMRETLEQLKSGTLAPTPAAPEALPVAADPSLPGGHTMPPDVPDEAERQAARARLLQAADRGPAETVTRTGPDPHPAPPQPHPVTVTPEAKPPAPDAPPAVTVTPEAKADKAPKGK